MKMRILLAAVALTLAFGCKDSFDNFDPDPTNPVEPGIEEFNASAFVEVVNTNGEPIEGAGITLGTTSASTDEYGVAFLDDVEMGSITYLTVDKNGYFHGSRRFYPREDRTSYLRVMLLDEVIVGEFESDQGGTVQSEGVTLDFPSDGITDASGNPYSGSVQVAMASIAGDDEALSDKMPGDLVGQTLTESYAVLASFGMAVVELQTPSGEPLQVLEGKPVEMSMDIPGEMTSAASSTIPMWSFDESKGIWIEETVATLSGGRYVAQIPHFTWWNYDAPFPVAKFGVSFVFESGAPATQLSVCLSAENLGVSKCSFTDDEGFLCGLVPSGEVMLMEVKDPCGDVIYSQEVGPLSDTVVIGPITLPESSITLSHITGIAVNCDDEPIEQGYVRVKFGGNSHLFSIEDNGSFDVSLINCDEDDLTINVIDLVDLKQSLPQTFIFDTEIDAGTIQACDEIEQIIVIEIPELDTTIIFLFPESHVEPSWTTVAVEGADSTGGTTSEFSMYFPGSEIGNYEGNVSFGTNNGTGQGSWFWNQAAEIVVTYFGTSGDYVQGTFSGEFNASGEYVGTFQVNGTFSALIY